MDRISASLVAEFVRENDLKNLAPDKEFEHFASFLAVQRHYPETFDTSELVTGKGGDTGIDGIAILINGSMVNDKESVAEFVAANGYLDVTFVFAQAETSSSFDTAKVGQFGFGVKDFFADHPSLQRNERITQLADVMNEIYNHSAKFKHGKPRCYMYYVTTGKWTGDTNLTARASVTCQDLDNLQFFSDVKFEFFGADQIQKLYHQTKNAISREFTFTNRTTIPEIPGVKEAYLGLIPAPTFVSLLEDDNGEIIKSLFYDNVRDWQDFNTVNSEMRDTLTSTESQVRFALMNNGVTVIAKTLRPTGDKFYIEDYQIVNGCQTSHVLFNTRSFLTEDVLVPLRLISTQDEGIITAIITATNRQTAVKTEQLFALSDFQKKLEVYFETFTGNESLHYERRSRQYNGVSKIEKTRIVTPTNLIRSFASIFLEEPHRTTRNYAALLEQIGKTIFAVGDRLEPYYLSAFALYQLEFLFRNSLLDSKYKAARFQILMAAQRLLDKNPIPRTNSNEMKKYCESSLLVWHDAAKAEKLLIRAAKIVDGVADGNLHRDLVRTQPFTVSVKKASQAADW